MTKVGTKVCLVGSCCGTVGSAVASATKGPGFEYSHRQLLLNEYTVNCF